MIGGKTVAFYICTTAFAVTLGLVFANMLNVGSGYKLDSGMLEGFEAVESPSFIDTDVYKRQHMRWLLQIWTRKISHQNS